LLDFCITKGFNTLKAEIASCLELSSDHTFIFITLHNCVLHKRPKPSLYNKYTDWQVFRETLEERIDKQIPLKSEADVETAVANLTDAIQQAARVVTPPLRPQSSGVNSPLYIKQKLTDKRKARRRWQTTRAPADKELYNKLTNELKHLLHTYKNNSVQQYLETLTPQKDSNYPLWKMARKLKLPQHHIPPLRQQDNTWARTDEQKDITFPRHLSTVFRPFPSQATRDEKKTISNTSLTNLIRWRFRFKKPA